jgi:hypothetical protein
MFVVYHNINVCLFISVASTVKNKSVYGGWFPRNAMARLTDSFDC